MSGNKVVSNPLGAFGQATFPGPESNFPQDVIEVTVGNSVAVAAHDAVALLWSETNRTLMCEPLDTDASAQSANGAFGVSLDAGAVGDSVRVVIRGFAFVNIGAGNSATKGQLALGSTTKGVVTSTAPAATVVVGTAVGTFIGDEDGTSDTAPLWVGQL